MKKSQYSYGDKPLNELTFEELLDCTEKMWSDKNSEIKVLEGKCSFYEKLLLSPHKTWGALVERAFTYAWVGFVMFLFGRALSTFQ